MCGPGKTILNTWRTLDPARFALTIAATRPAGDGRNALLDHAAGLNASVLPFDIGGAADVSGAWRLARVLREGRFDLLQTHDAQTRRLGTLAAWLARVPHVTSVHGWIFNTRKERAARWLDRRVIRLADHVITISDRLQKDVVSAGTGHDRVSLLRNAVLLDDYVNRGGGPMLRRELQIPDNHVVFSIIGRLSQEKGHDIFLEAARRVAANHAAVTFLVVGDGPLRAPLEASAATAGLQGRVRFIGHRGDMAAVYDATTVVVSTSYTEGIPNVLLEGFAYGRPAVATPVGGVPEIMSDTVQGYLVQPGQPVELTERLERFIANPSTAEEMGVRARRGIESQFDFRRRTRELEHLYERVVEEWRRSAAKEQRQS